MSRASTGWVELVQQVGATQRYCIRNFRGESLGWVEVTPDPDGSWRWMRVDGGSAGVVDAATGRQLSAFQVARRAWALSEDEQPTELPDDVED